MQASGTPIFVAEYFTQDEIIVPDTCLLNKWHLFIEHGAHRALAVPFMAGFGFWVWLLCFRGRGQKERLKDNEKDGRDLVSVLHSRVLL
jgi:hypothetical protein